MADKLAKMVSEKPLVIFSKSNSFMTHTLKALFYDFGANPIVHELDEIPRGKELELALGKMGCNPTVPVVFIGGKFVGGANEVMSLHFTGSLIPMLKRPGVLWVGFNYRKLLIKINQG